jgi:hypothetical protein
MIEKLAERYERSIIHSFTKCSAGDMNENP